MNLAKTICDDLRIPESLVKEALALAYRRYKKIKIKKRTGGERTVVQPSAKLKVVQYWLLHNAINHLPVHPSAMAYRKKLSILSNAERHQYHHYFVKVDLKDFFPSLSFADFLPILRKWHKASPQRWTLNAEAKSLIQRACFDANSRLPIGYPTSPSIANAIMHKFDIRIEEQLARREKQIGAVTYTRYADDMIFSTKTPGSSGAILALVHAIVTKMESPRLTINESKTRISSSPGGSAFVTGLRVCSDHHLTIHRKYKDHVRLLLSLYRKGRLAEDDVSSLQGHLSHVRHVDPAFFTKLNQKYFQEIAQFVPSILTSGADS